MPWTLPEVHRKPLGLAAQTVLSSLAGSNIMRGHERPASAGPGSETEKHLLCMRWTHSTAPEGEVPGAAEEVPAGGGEACPQDCAELPSPAKDLAALNAQPKPNTLSWDPALSPEPISSPLPPTRQNTKRAFKEIYRIKKTKQEIDEQNQIPISPLIS